VVGLEAEFCRPKGAGLVEAFVEGDGVDLPSEVGFDVRDIGAETGAFHLPTEVSGVDSFF
jgi:hypothetical protein